MLSGDLRIWPASGVGFVLELVPHWGHNGVRAILFLCLSHAIRTAGPPFGSDATSPPSAVSSRRFMRPPNCCFPVSPDRLKGSNQLQNIARCRPRYVTRRQTGARMAQSAAVNNSIFAHIRAPAPSRGPGEARICRVVEIVMRATGDAAGPWPSSGATPDQASARCGDNSGLHRFGRHLADPTGPIRTGIDTRG